MKISDILMEAADVTENQLEAIAEKVKATEFFQINKKAILNKIVLLHGSTRMDGSVAFRKLKAHTREGPKHTSVPIAKFVGEELVKKFGRNIRDDSIYCSTSVDDAESYGAVSAIIPVGDYKMYFSPSINDLTVELGLGEANLYMYITNDGNVSKVLKEFGFKAPERQSQILHSKATGLFDLAITMHLTAMKNHGTLTLGKNITDDIREHLSDWFNAELSDGVLEGDVDNIPKLTNHVIDTIRSSIVKKKEEIRNRYIDTLDVTQKITDISTETRYSAPEIMLIADHYYAIPHSLFFSDSFMSYLSS